MTISIGRWSQRAKASTFLRIIYEKILSLKFRMLKKISPSEVVYSPEDEDLSFQEGCEGRSESEFDISEIKIQEFSELEACKTSSEVGSSHSCGDSRSHKSCKGNKDSVHNKVKGISKKHRNRGKRKSAKSKSMGSSKTEIFDQTGKESVSGVREASDLEADEWEIVEEQYVETEFSQMREIPVSTELVRAIDEQRDKYPEATRLIIDAIEEALEHNPIDCSKKCEYKKALVWEDLTDCKRLNCEESVKYFMFRFGDRQKTSNMLYHFCMCLSKCIIDVFGYKYYEEESPEILPKKINDISEAYQNMIEYEYKKITDHHFRQLLHAYALWLFNHRLSADLVFRINKSFEVIYGAIILQENEKEAGSQKSQNTEVLNKPPSDNEEVISESEEGQRNGHQQRAQKIRRHGFEEGSSPAQAVLYGKDNLYSTEELGQDLSNGQKAKQNLRDRERKGSDISKGRIESQSQSIKQQVGHHPKGNANQSPVTAKAKSQMYRRKTPILIRSVPSKSPQTRLESDQVEELSRKSQANKIEEIQSEAAVKKEANLLSTEYKTNPRKQNLRVCKYQIQSVNSLKKMFGQNF